MFSLLCSLCSACVLLHFLKHERKAVKRESTSLHVLTGGYEGMREDNPHMTPL